MSYLNCPRCGLSVQAHADRSAVVPCPRCAGRVGLTVPMYETERPRPPVVAADTDTRSRPVRRRRESQTQSI